jgi:ferredoxin
MTLPLQSALAVAASYAAPAPVPAVEYRSQGRVLVMGLATRVAEVARQLAGELPVTALSPDALPSDAGYVAIQGELVGVAGWLGEFEVAWKTDGGVEQASEFDLVLDLGATPYFTMHQPPQGYFAPADDAALVQALAEIRDGVGEFEKPKFFLYNENICAHSRSRLEGCNRCVEVCSTKAIRGDGNRVYVEPHLCMGCGACATVCPTGAMQYNFPSVSYWGGKLKAMLEAYRDAGGEDAVVLLHDPAEGAELLQSVQLPANVIPYETFHIASVGLDRLLGAIALGANRVAILATGREAPQYATALRGQMTLGEQILDGMGYGTGHFHLVDQQGLQLLAEHPPAVVPRQAASFRLFDEKRTTLDFCVEHFVRHAPAEVPGQIALAEGAPYGTVEVKIESCTLCYSCVSACPAAALQDGAGTPMLKFVERNCVQCGLCENACPEDAISLNSRLLLTADAKQARILHQDVPFHCVSCGKPFATAHMVGSMLHKLSGHSMFATPEAKRRLQMCGDCRVKDMMVSELAGARNERRD